MAGFEWALVRVVPRVERGEFVNAGAVVYSRALDFLAARVELDEARLRALDPSVDVAAVRRHLDAFADLSAGRLDRPGPVPASVARSTGDRFRWLTAPRSSVVQTSPVHTGITEDPAAELDRLVATMVRPLRARPLPA